MVIVSYEDAAVRIAKRIEDRIGAAAPKDLYVLEHPLPLWTTDKGESKPGGHWSGLWEAIGRIGARLVVIDPASAALEGATNDSGPVRRFMDQLRREAETSGAGVLVIAHDTKSARNEARAGGDPGAGAVAGSAAWFDASRGVLYFRSNPTGQDEWLLECIKANYGQTGWGAMLNVAKTKSGQFCGFEQAGQPLPRSQVEDLKTGWEEELKKQRRRPSNKSKTDSGKDREAGEPWENI